MKNNGEIDFMNCLCECAKNIIKGRVPLSVVQKRTLAKRKQSLRKLALKKTSLKTKRKIVMKGGFLGALLGPIVTALGSIFGLSGGN